MLIERPGGARFGGQTKSEVRMQKAECRGEERRAKARHKPTARSQKAKPGQEWRGGDADFDDGFGVGVRIYMRWRKEGVEGSRIQGVECNEN